MNRTVAKLLVTPVTIGEARAFIERHHSHHHAPQGGLFAVGVSACMCSLDSADRGDHVHAMTLRCVAVMSRPVARKLDARGNVAELTRCASDGTKHAASMCIAAATRMSLAGGYTRLVSYTLLGESGASYLAAGWRITGTTNNERGWDTRAGRTQARQTGAKVRWETGPDALPLDAESERRCREAVGVVPVLARTEDLPLFKEIA